MLTSSHESIQLLDGIMKEKQIQLYNLINGSAIVENKQEQKEKLLSEILSIQKTKSLVESTFQVCIVNLLDEDGFYLSCKILNLETINYFQAYRIKFI